MKRERITGISYDTANDLRSPYMSKNQKEFIGVMASLPTSVIYNQRSSMGKWQYVLGNLALGMTFVRNG